MHRDIDLFLDNWRLEVAPVPILLRGARQVGKSYTASSFATRSFKSFVELNFELEPQLIGVFADSLEPAEIISKITAIKNCDIKVGETLVFFDEVQLCPRAILAMRYFYERMPGLHLIAAGSLLDFLLCSGEISIPVGRIQYLFMKPMSFYEFLAARHEKLLDVLRKTSIIAGLDEIFHTKLINYLREYFIVGGMPKAVQAFIDSSLVLEAMKVLDRINLNYRDDFSKYASDSKEKYLDMVFMSGVKQIGEKFKYSKVDASIASRELKHALNLLIKAGVLHQIKRATGSGLPFEAGASDTNFKVSFVDIGIAQRLLGVGDGLAQEIILSDDLNSVAAGKLAEQFVAQELIATVASTQMPKLYYWERSTKTGAAELDLLINHGSSIVPVEVKSGTTGRLKSLRMYMNEYKSPVGIRISQRRLEYGDGLLSVPFYMIPELARLLDESL